MSSKRKRKSRPLTSPVPDSDVEFMLDALCKRRGIDAQTLVARLHADDCDVSQSQVYRDLRRGPMRVLKRIAAYCRALDCSVTDLILYAPERRFDARLSPKFRLPGS